MSLAHNRSHCHAGWRDSYNYPDECGIHAEVAALNKAPTTAGATLYVLRVRSGGQLAMSRPCHYCLDTIREHGIKTIVYTTDHGIAKERV